MRVRLFAIAPLVLALFPALALSDDARSSDFQVAQSDLPNPFVVIAYGDTRFTNPSRTEPTNPAARRLLVRKIAAEHPDALLISGDLPWHGADGDDYRVFEQETEPWRAAKLRVYPALGNHELNGEESVCLQNWWNTFPQLRLKRWYSVQFGDFTYFINLDSNSSLLPKSAQLAWLKEQLNQLPSTTKFVFLNLHHPPVDDRQPEGENSHNVRANETGLAALLTATSASKHIRFIVNAGHVHNYERFLLSGNTYLVSGGGGAKPLAVIRDARDLYQQNTFPNYHYVKFIITPRGIDATMIRLETPNAPSPEWRVRDQFQIAPR